MIRDSSWAYDITGAALVVNAAVDAAIEAAGAAEMAGFRLSEKPAVAAVLAAAVVAAVVVAAPNGLSVRPVETGAADDAAGAAAVVEPPKLNTVEVAEGIGEANRDDMEAAWLAAAVLAGAGVAAGLIPKLLPMDEAAGAGAGAPRVRPVLCPPNEKEGVLCAEVAAGA